MEVDILRELEKTKKIDFKHRSDLQSRTYGFFTEWIYGLFIFSLEKKNKKIKYTQLVFFDNTAKTTYETPEKDATPIVIGTNRWLLPATTVTIQSVLDNRRNDDKYEFLICHSEISKHDQATVKNFFSSIDGVSIKFIDFKSSTPVSSNGQYWDYDLKAQHFVYILPWILKNYSKVLFLHSDVLIKTNIMKLHDINLEGKAIAAPRDYLRISEHRQNTKLYKFRKYKLSMEDPYDYVSSAIVVLDLNKIRSEMFLEDCIRFSMGNFNHLDIINRLYSGNVKFLSSEWNTTIETTDSLKLLSEYMPKVYLDDLRKSQKSPSAIHYLSYPKPWQNPARELATDFWEIARRTPFYERLLQNIVIQNGSYVSQNYDQPYRPSLTIRFFKKILPQSMHPFAKRIKNFFTKNK